MTTVLNASRHLGMVLAWAITAPVVVAQTDLQNIIADTEDNREVSVPGGRYTDTLTIDRPLELTGEILERCILEVTADKPAISVLKTGPVTIENMTIKWQLATSAGRQGAASAVFVKDGKLTLRNCKVIALGNDQRCPMAVASTGFSNVQLENCRFEGFNFTIGYSGGAEGAINDCVILNPGHCGLTVYTGSTIDVARNIISGSKYHAVRSTGGTLNMNDNLIIRNKNRGVYLGNKSASGRLINNVILGNGTGISAFAQTDVTIKNNLILDSSFAGLGSRDSCPIKVIDNLFQGNTRGVAVFEESGRTRITVGQNSFWDNKTNAENFALPSSTILVDPQLRAPQDGDFIPQAEELMDNGQGLTDGEVLRRLWEKWQSVSAGN